MSTFRLYLRELLRPWAGARGRASVLAACLLTVVAPAFAQSPEGETPHSLFLTSRPDATIVISKSHTGADLVQVSVLKPTYSEDLLRRQIARLGQELQSDPRGVDVGYARTVAVAADSTVLRANFAVDGLIDRAAGSLRVQSIARGFSLETPSDRLDALMILFQGEAPTANTLRSCAPPEPGCNGAMIEGRNEGKEIGIEYRLKYLTHDPAKIDLPDTPRDVPERRALVVPVEKGSDWTITLLVVVAALAAGALVYSLLLGSRRRAGPRSVAPRGRSSGGSGDAAKRRHSRSRYAPSIV